MPEPVTLQELKDFARIDFTDDDALVTGLGTAAREYVEQATGRDYSSAEADPVPERAKLAIKSLAAFWYESRTPLGTVPMGGPPLPMHVRSIIHQLTDWSRLCPPEEMA